MTTTKKVGVIAGALAVGSALVYMVQSPNTGPTGLGGESPGGENNSLTVQPSPTGLELLWTGKPNEFYSLGYATNPAGPWAEIWGGAIGEGRTIGTAVDPRQTNVYLTAHPPTSDGGSKWGCELTWDYPPMSNRLISVYVQTTNDQTGFFHLWTRKVSPPVPTPAQLRISRGTN